MDWRSLYQKLLRIEALHDGATTPGERDAAARARIRLLARLEGAEAADPVRLIYLHELQSRGHFTNWSPQECALDSAVVPPEPEAVVSLLTRWTLGEVSASEVRDWAAWYVDKALLPEHPPDDARSIPIEVVLQLSSLHAQPLTVDDVPALIRFLRTPPDASVAAWHAWFRYLDGIDWRARRGIRRPA